MNKQKEREIKKLLRVGKEEKILSVVYLDSFYNDEPKIFSFGCLLKSTDKLINKSSFDNTAGGSSFVRKKSLLKALGEAFERYSIAMQPKNLIWDSYKHLRKKAINPNKFVSFSGSQNISEFKTYNDDNSKLNWITAFSFIRKRAVFIPAQLIFVPYRFNPEEPIIRFPITTGAACYSSLKGAILRGLLEVIERDAFMISYLNKLSPNIINIRNSQNKTFKKISSLIERYNFEFYVLDISTDVPVYSILAIIIDKTGLGPAVSLGMKSDLNVNDAIIGAIEEAFRGRFWIRDIMTREKLKNIKEIKKKKRYISDLKERGLFWSRVQMIDKIKFFFRGKKIPVENLPVKTKNLNTLLEWFKKENIEVLSVNVTPSGLKNKQIYVAKVLVPEFQPLYLDESFPYWEGRRLREVPKKLGFDFLKEINKFPHPFL